MYLIGADHPNKFKSQVLLQRASASGDRFVTSVEVLQEVLHLYTSIGRRDAINPALKLMLDLCDDIFPIDERLVLRAAEIAQLPAGLSARDALHISVMEKHGVRRIMTFDADFDKWPGLLRIHGTQ